MNVFPEKKRTHKLKRFQRVFNAFFPFIGTSCCYWTARQNSAPSRGTNLPNGGLLFHATAATNSICAGAGSGERAACRNKKRTFKAPAHLIQHRAAARRSDPPHDDPSPTGWAPRHGAGIRPPEGRNVSSGHIRARLARVLCRSSFVVVVDVGGQWCTHFDARNNRRLVAIETACVRLPKS